MDAATKPGARSHEVELKLAVAPDDVPSLKAHPLLKARADGPPSTRDIVSVYYDTIDGALADAGYTLRVRSGGGRTVQTVKASGDVAMLPVRLEAEAELPGDTPDLRFVPDPELRAELAAAIGAHALVPRYETVIRRTEWTLRGGASVIGAALDVGEIRTRRGRSRRASVSELELELLEGPRAELWDVARLLSADLPLRPRVGSKSMRGERLTRGAAPRAAKAGRLDLSGAATLDDAASLVLAHCLAHIAANEPMVTEARQPEGVHQLRVALRRLRAALSVVRKFARSDVLKRLGREARTLAKALGSARDLDVFCGEMLPPVQEAAPAEPGLAELAKRAATARRQAWAALKPALAPQALTPFLLDLALAIDERRWSSLGADAALHLNDPPRKAAETALSRRLAKAAALGESVETLSIAERHALRIELKKLRYAGEFFESLFPRKATLRYLEALAELQDVFGAMNDAATVEETLKALAPADAPPELARAAGLVQGWYACRMADDLKSARKRWKAFARETPFWA